MIVLAILVGILLFLTGFYTGLWVQRHNREVVVHEVPKIVETEKVVEVEVPKLIEVPMPAKKQGPALVITGQQQKNVLDPTSQAESQRMNDLLSGMPEM